MKLWLLDRLSTPKGKIYDCFDGHLVAAPSEDAARMLAANRPADEGAACWLDPTAVKCEHIGESLNDETGILMSDFHAG